jgi:hypothetical protein
MNEESIKRGFEVKDANSHALFLTGAALLAIIGISLAVLFAVFGGRIGPRASSEGTGFRGAASVHTGIEADWVKLDAENAAHLTGYRWIDKKSGVVQIPIERAMAQLCVKEVKP